MEPLVSTITETWSSSSITRVLLWFFGASFAAVILPLIYAKIVGSRYPVINKSPAWDLFNFSSTISYLKKGNSLVTDGFKKFAGRPFLLNTEHQHRVVLSPEYIDAINAEPDLDFITFVNQEFLTHLPCFKFFYPPGHLVNDMVRTRLTQNLPKLTQPLSDEAASAFEDRWGSNDQWTERVLKIDIQNIISRLSAIVFVGPELAHNAEWQEITVNVTINGFLGVVECRFFPAPLQWLASKVMPHARRAMFNLTRGRALVKPLIDRRKKEKADAAAAGVAPPEHNDAIEWLEQTAAKTGVTYYDPCTTQLSLALAAIHTSTDLMTETIYQLCQRPELIEPLRQEAIRVIGEKGWAKTALYDLRMLDSVLKETQRILTSTGLVMSRVAKADVSLPGNINLKKGDIIAVSTHWMQDVQYYDNPEDFDPFRFARRRDDPKLANKSHLVSTSADHTGFSHGKHACPGRFFAANEIKIALVHMLLKYDFKIKDLDTTKRMIFGINSASSTSAKIEFRRRKPEIEL